jgi:hypothetical protein
VDALKDSEVDFSDTPESDAGDVRSRRREARGNGLTECCECRQSPKEEQDDHNFGAH